MSNIDKRALREAAKEVIAEGGTAWFDEGQLADKTGLDIPFTDAAFIASASPETVLALLDELEGEAVRIKELESQRALAFMACNRWRDKCVEAEKKLEAAEMRIAELEAREVNGRFPLPKDTSQGWKIDPEFISKIQDAIGYD